MRIRRARYEDGLFVYALSQEPSVKAASIRNEPFSLEQHLAWWERRFMSRTQAWWIGEAVGRPIGYVRYGRCGPAECTHIGSSEASLAVHPDHRGRGHGARLLDRTRIDALRELEVESVLALIRQENEASLATFRRAGYHGAGTEERLGTHLAVLCR